MTTYQGLDVLELDYNRLGSIQDQHRRKFVLLDGQTGPRRADEQAPAPAPARPFTWTAVGRAEMAELRTFLDARRGRAIPFWFPTYQWDLSLDEDLEVGNTIATLRWVGYAQQMFGTTGGRRHVALWNLGSHSMDYYRVTDAEDPGTKLTESITLDPAAVRDYPAGQTVLSFLRLVRLDEDRVTVEYPSTEIAQATIQVRDLPLEAPV